MQILCTLKDKKIVSGFSQTPQYISFYFYLEYTFRSVDHPQVIFTILRSGACNTNNIHVTWNPIILTNVLKYIKNNTK